MIYKLENEGCAKLENNLKKFFFFIYFDIQNNVLKLAPYKHNTYCTKSMIPHKFIFGYKINKITKKLNEISSTDLRKSVHFLFKTLYFYRF